MHIPQMSKRSQTIFNSSCLLLAKHFQTNDRKVENDNNSSPKTAKKDLEKQSESTTSSYKCATIIGKQKSYSFSNSEQRLL